MGRRDDMIRFIYLVIIPALYFDRGVLECETGRLRFWHFLGMVQMAGGMGVVPHRICIYDWIGLMSERASLGGLDFLYHFLFILFSFAIKRAWYQ